jgi:endonuclease/exonuclease/phosphatase family metal-dependent hydrolase
MYLGGNVGLVLGADFSNQASVVAAATALWGQVQATDFPERAEALAAEIDEARPHVVGIQEIPQYAVLDGSYQPIDVQDHLGILMEELQGLPYELAAVQTNTTVILPVLFQTGVRLVQYVDRIAVLVRSDLDVTGVTSDNYDAAQVINPLISILRGWVKVSADVGGVPYHFVNTHLETQAFTDTQMDQADELLNDVLNDLDGVTILMGDLNSDAEGGPGDPSWTPTYGTLLDAGFPSTASPAVRPIW